MSPLAALYFSTVLIGSVIAFLKGTDAERTVMKALCFEWVTTYAAFQFSGILDYGVPVLPYMLIDALVVWYLVRHLTTDWQVWIIRLSMLHIIIHISFLFGVAFTDVPATNRPYADFLTLLGYLQIGFTIWASFNHEWRHRLNPSMARKPYRALFPVPVFLARR